VSEAVEEPAIMSLCTGYGGLEDAVREIFGGHVVAWSDISAGSIAVMSRRLPGVPSLGSVKSINWFAQSCVDILTAGYPCQPFSNAGKRLGTEDPRHLWPWIAQGIGVLRPRIVVLENVAAHLRRGFDVVSADLARMGYRIAWGITRAADVGAPHPRRRLFIVAVAEDSERQPRGEWWESASREAQGGRAWSDAGRRSGVATADTESERRAPWRDGPPRTETQQSESVVNRDAATDTHGAGLETRNRCDSDELPAVERSGDAVTHSDRDGQPRWTQRDSKAQGGIETPQRHYPDRRVLCTADRGRWGEFADAVARWESVRGVRAPDPTERGARGGQVLSPRFVEWMMGLAPGHVTDTPGLSRPKQLELLGNGVVPQQAEYSIRHLVNLLQADEKEGL
jgi:DNA (cytosine-5)-methyltransferase 1